VISASSTIVGRQFHTFSARAIDPSGTPNRVPLFAPTKRARETRTSCMTISIENVSQITAGEEISSSSAAAAVGRISTARSMARTSLPNPNANRSVYLPTGSRAYVVTASDEPTRECIQRIESRRFAREFLQNQR
jgi:hypothetical protein